MHPRTYLTTERDSLLDNPFFHVEKSEALEAGFLSPEIEFFALGFKLGFHVGGKRVVF